MIGIVLDLETTGKLHKDHRIIEFSARRCDLDKLVELEAIKMRFNPKRNIDAAALRVHNIPLEELKNEPTWEDKAAEVAAILASGDVLVGHNIASFDLLYLIQEFERVGVETPNVAIFDTMVEGQFASELGKSPSLLELCYSLDVDYDQSLAHKGDYDTEVLRDALFQGLRLGWFNLNKKEN